MPQWRGARHRGDGGHHGRDDADAGERETVAQLRALLHSEHALSHAEEEALIAGLLRAERVPLAEDVQRRAAIVAHPGLVQAGVVGLNAGTVLLLSLNGIWDLVGSAAVALLGVNVALLCGLLATLACARALRAADQRLARTIRRGARTAIATAATLGAAEWILISWPTYSSTTTMNNLVHWAIGALIVSLIIAMVSAAYLWGRQRRLQQTPAAATARVARRAGR